MSDEKTKPNENIRTKFEYLKSKGGFFWGPRE